ncbi:MAG: hypothetical protein LBN22_08125 [Clostridiales Family XIII bacterium]|nr:hypothetical protein [Clostridiales Family XIII bacterium]
MRENDLVHNKKRSPNGLTKADKEAPKAECDLLVRASWITRTMYCLKLFVKKVSTNIDNFTYLKLMMLQQNYTFSVNQDSK